MRLMLRHAGIVVLYGVALMSFSLLVVHITIDDWEYERLRAHLVGVPVEEAWKDYFARRRIPVALAALGLVAGAAVGFRAVLGAATTGFVIIPRLGQAGTLSVLAALQAVVAAVVIGTRRPFRLGSVGSCVLGGLAATALCVVLPRWDATLLGLTFLNHFRSWSIDNDRRVLILNERR